MGTRLHINYKCANVCAFIAKCTIISLSRRTISQMRVSAFSTPKWTSHIALLWLLILFYVKVVFVTWSFQLFLGGSPLLSTWCIAFVLLYYALLNSRSTNCRSTVPHLSGRYTVRCNRADIAVGVSSYNDIEPRALHGLTHATCHSDWCQRAGHNAYAV